MIAKSYKVSSNGRCPNHVLYYKIFAKVGRFYSCSISIKVYANLVFVLMME